jgi:GT2 family glycosyltransferase
MRIYGLKTKLRFAYAVARSRLVGELTPMAVRAVRKGGDRWEAVGKDPQFIFPAPAAGASFLTFVIDARPEFIRPQLYFDWGDDFRGYDVANVEYSQVAVIRLRLGDMRGLQRIRVDPADEPAVFRFRCLLDRGAISSSDEARRLVEEARDQGAVAILETLDLMDFAPPAPGRPIGLKRSPRTVQQHFMRTIEVARRKFSTEIEAPAEEAETTPLISFVVPVYDTPPTYLDDLLNSFRRQKRGLAELVLSDDGSTAETTIAWLKDHAKEPGLLVVRNEKNGGIAAASNQGIVASRGEWIGFVDHDDALAPHAAVLLAETIRENPDVKFIYTDEMIADKYLNGVDYFFKPAFDEVLLSGVNYINHLSLYRRDRLVEIGCFRPNFDGSQDYDLLLRYLSGIGPWMVRHLPYPAYIWRRDGSSYSVKFLDRATTNARRAISEAYSNARPTIAVEPAIDPNLHRLRFDAALPSLPKLSIVIPNKNSLALMSRLLYGLVNNTNYPGFEIIVVDNGSSDPEVLELYKRTRRDFPDFRALIQPAPFNFSRQVNLGIEVASGEYVLLLNNDIEIMEAEWLQEMVSCFQYPRTGIVGARLLYPNRTLQHAGVIVGLGDFAGHWFVNQAADYPGPMARLLVRSSMTAVTAACMLISRECLNRTGLFDEQNFAVAYNDVDFCLRAHQAGFRAVYTPFATLVHHESASRGRDDKGANRPRFLRDQAELLERHGTEGFQDLAYSPWYGRDRAEPYRIALDTLPKAR